jgi:hypothetical protein
MGWPGDPMKPRETTNRRDCSNLRPSVRYELMA